MFNDKLMKDVLQLPHKMLSFLVQWKNLATQKLARELEILQASLLVNIRELGGGGQGNVPRDSREAPSSN